MAVVVADIIQWLPINVFLILKEMSEGEGKGGK